MNWITIAISAYFLMAIVAIVDKFMLSKKAGNPLVYAFFLGILNCFAFILWFFSFSFLSPAITLIALACGVCFFVAVFLFYKAMSVGEVSKVVSIVGGVSPLFIMFLSYVFLGERLPGFWMLSLGMLIVGGFLLALNEDLENSRTKKKRRFPTFSFLAALFFALSFFFTKVVFLNSTFLNGFVWTRVGLFLAAVFLLLLPSFRRALKSSPLRAKKSLMALFVGNKIIGALSFVILNYAIMLGSVTIINALQGVEFFVIFFTMAFLTIFYPGFLKESFSTRAIMMKIAGIILISAGVIVLVVT